MSSRRSFAAAAASLSLLRLRLEMNAIGYSFRISVRHEWSLRYSFCAQVAQINYGKYSTRRDRPIIGRDRARGPRSPPAATGSAAGRSSHGHQNLETLGGEG